MPSCVHGYHYLESSPSRDAREPTNNQARYAVAVRKAAVTVGHVPRRISGVLTIFEVNRDIPKQALASYMDVLIQCAVNLPCSNYTL